MFRRAAAVSITVLALAGSSLVASPAQAAPQSGNRVITKKADVDGDGRLDRITVRYTEFGQGLTLSVRPARGRTTTMTMAADLEQAGDPSVRTGAVDGVRGSDIVVTEAFGDIPHFAVLTWRKGRLVRLDPPGGRRGDTWTINPNYEGQPGYWGYSFGTSRGVRTVTTWQLSPTKSGRFYGPKVTYRWTSTGWKRIASTKVSLKQSEAARTVTFGGLKLS